MAARVRFVENGHRLYESQRGLTELGIPIERQIYPNLPDGQLQDKTNLLTDDIFKHARRRRITQFVTFDEQGADKHADHIAVHSAVMEAADRLEQHGRYAGILALNSLGQGELVVPVGSDAKINAMRHHTSQMRINTDSPDVILEPQKVYEGYHTLYNQQETYDRLR